MSFQQRVLPASQRLANSKLNAEQSAQLQTWAKEGYKLADSQEAIPAGADQRTFSIPSPFVQNSNNKTQVPSAPQSFLFYKGAPEPAPAPAATPAPAPAPAAEPVPQTVPGNAALSIPGIDVRLTGEQVGISPAQSTERKAKNTSTGSSKLTIPRSSGASGLNIG
jgi:hypothetical protein